jgi:single-strand DNA-binding protein
MAEGLNKAMLIGNLGADPELRFTTNNRPVLKFRLATTESYMDQNQTRQEVTHWHQIVLWGKRGEALSKILSKGSRVYVEGRIETRSYEDANGVKKSATDIVASNLILLGSRNEAGAGAHPGGGAPAGGVRAPAIGGGAGGGARPAPAGGGRPVPDADDFPPDDFGGGGSGGDDDIPF